MKTETSSFWRGLGHRLKTIRELCGLSQAELSRKTGINATELAHFEGGGRKPNLEHIVKIVKALGVSADVLLGTARP
jgi:transcriptional regulator with XRE-family HTH domain